MLELRITEMLAETSGEAEPLAANENDLLAAAETQATLVAVHAALTTVEPLPVPAPRRELLVEPAAKVDPSKATAKLESHLLEPAAPSIVAIEPRIMRDEREKPAVQAAVAPALSEPESFPEEIFAPPHPEPAQARQQDIVALINALTQAEKIALFS
jgi:hypothetical protein